MKITFKETVELAFGTMYRGGGSADANRIDDVLQALSHPTRRDVIECLIDCPQETMTLDELAENLMARRDVERYNDRHGLEMMLHHVHVPKLADHQVVEYDSRTRRVRYRGNAEFETLLDNVREWEGK